MALPGTYPNASHKWCWETCTACFRCSNKGRYTACAGCSGRHDPSGCAGPDIDDYCDCKNGILRWRARKTDQMIIVKYNRNPFNGTALKEQVTDDERDWNAYLYDLREKMDNPTFNPIQYEDYTPPT